MLRLTASTVVTLENHEKEEEKQKILCNFKIVIILRKETNETNKKFYLRSLGIIFALRLTQILLFQQKA